MNKERIGFISTRFSGTDGVSLEASKWAEVLESDGHEVYWYAGLINRPTDKSYCVPEAHFDHPESQWLNEKIWGHSKRSRLITNRIRSISHYLKETLHEFVKHYDISVIIIENAVTIPMNLPLGVALTEFILESEIPAIAHHHDFYWERSRFTVNSVSDYLEMAFPPRHPSLEHVVINKNAMDTLAWRKGTLSTLIPNVINFNNPPTVSDTYTENMKKELGFEPDDIIFLQPTRVVPRKGIEHAIRLVNMLQNPKIKLCITHDSGDEGFSYEEMLRETAEGSGVDLRFVSTKVGESRQYTPEGNKIYSLLDVYTCADLVTYPSLYEGFGNAFLEAIYLKKPLLINRYDIFMRDIEPKGFKAITIDGFVTPKTVEQVQTLLKNGRLDAMTEHNFELGKKHYSYEVLREKLRHLLNVITTG